MMPPIFVVAFAALALAAVALAVYALKRRPQRVVAVAQPADEFAGLGEAERCDYVFALGALDDPSSVVLLRRAMDDPSDVVAIAAARSLLLTGRPDEVENFLRSRSDARSQRISSTLELLG